MRFIVTLLCVVAPIITFDWAHLSVGGGGLIAAARSVETPRWCQKPGFSVRF
jgi:hypothetical protein